MKRIGYIFLLSVSALAVSCIKDPAIDDMRTGNDGIEALLTLNLPGGGFDVVTRALTADDEHKIVEVDVLVFRDNGSEKVFYERRQATLINGTAASKSFKLTVTPSADPLQFVAFANVRDIIDGLTLNTTLTRAQVLDMIVWAMNGSDKWNSAAGTYDPLPMWGETSFSVRTDASSIVESIRLLRAHARIDVTDAADNFTMSWVRLYNSSMKGRLAPSDGNWNAATGKVISVSLPSGGRGVNSFLQYPISGNSLVRDIYAFEAPASTGNTDQSAPCLVVAGSWNGEETSYYRIDFFNQSTSAYLPLLRNHLYEVEITSVFGRGYPTAAEALAAGFTNLTATTHEHDDGGVGSVVWDGRDMLAMSQTSFTLYPEEITLDVGILTNYSGGWSAVANADCAGWLAVVVGTGTGVKDVESTLELKVEENDTMSDRTGTVTVTAGRLKQTITVVQKFENLIALEVSDVELVFPAKTSESRQLRIEWDPRNRDCGLELVAVDGYTAVDVAIPANISDQGLSSETGAYILTMQPAAVTLTIFTERRSILRVTATNAEGQRITKDVLLRQFDYAIAYSGRQEVYNQGTTYFMRIRANDRWEIVIPNNTVLDGTITYTGEPTITGEEISFTTTRNIGQSVRLQFQLVNDPSVYASLVVKLNENTPNSYIVHPEMGINYVDIPIKKAFQVWRTDRDLVTELDATVANWGAELLWQDEQNLIPSTTPPTLYGTTEDNAYIRVTTNNAGREGNAVVAFTIGTGADRIKWSWHIWVLKRDNDPRNNTYTQPRNGTIIMDRNLGATTNFEPEDSDDVRSFGLLYQWGRKDPMPGARTTSSTTYDSKYIYNINNVRLTEGVNYLNHTTGTGVKRMQTPKHPNLDNAIFNPLTFYWGYHNGETNAEMDWYTNQTGANHRTDLWGPAYKSEFDPCPEGWKVPTLTNENIIDYVAPGDFQNNVGVTLSVGFFPAAGYRLVYGNNDAKNSHGYIYTVGTTTYLWAASTSGAFGSLFALNNTNAVLTSSTVKSRGLSIRCVKIE